MRNLQKLNFAFVPSLCNIISLKIVIRIVITEKFGLQGKQESGSQITRNLSRPEWESNF